MLPFYNHRPGRYLIQLFWRPLRPNSDPFNSSAAPPFLLFPPCLLSLLCFFLPLWYNFFFRLQNDLLSLTSVTGSRVSTINQVLPRPVHLSSCPITFPTVRSLALLSVCLPHCPFVCLTSLSSNLLVPLIFVRYLYPPSHHISAGHGSVPGT